MNVSNKYNLVDELEKVTKELLDEIEKREKVTKEYEKLKKKHIEISKKYDALRKSKLGRLTIKYWNIRRKK